MIFLAFALKIFAALMAAGVARARREYAPVAGFLLISTAADVLRLVIASCLPTSSVTAFHSAGLVALCDLDTALWLTWPAGLAASALVVFLGRRPWAVVFLWGALSLVLAAAYPWSRGEHLRQVYLAAELAAQAVALGGGILWTTRRDPPHVEHAALALLLATELGTLIAGPWRAIFTTWHIAQLMYVGAFAGVVAVQARCIVEVASAVILVTACPTIGLLVYVAWEMRARGRAFERFARSAVGLLREGVAVSGIRTHHSAPHVPARDELQLLRRSLAIPDPSARRIVDVTRDSDAAPAPIEDSGAIVNVELSPDQRFDSTGGRWLKQVVDAARSAGLPPADDTPAPPGRRAPSLPPRRS